MPLTWDHLEVLSFWNNSQNSYNIFGHVWHRFCLPLVRNKRRAKSSLNKASGLSFLKISTFVMVFYSEATAYFSDGNSPFFDQHVSFIILLAAAKDALKIDVWNDGQFMICWHGIKTWQQGPREPIASSLPRLPWKL